MAVSITKREHRDIGSGKKGQFVFTTILMGFIGVVMLAAILPAMTTIINGVVNNNTENGGVDNMTGVVLVLVPMFIVLAVIVALLDYNKPKVVYA